MSCSVSGIGLAGFGTVGSGVWKILEEHGRLIESRSQGSAAMEIRKIAVRDLSKKREGNTPAELFTTSLMEVVENPSVDIVVELIGGTEAAFDLVTGALKAGKPVVTGNKALLAERGTELFAISKETNTPIYFEAAVAGGIPIIKAVQQSLVGNQIESIAGIINGTSNYILQRMTEAGLGYPEALKEAKDLGYAEADETLDVNGWDAAHKAIILGSIAHGFLINYKDVYVRGIEKVTPLDIQFASDLGYVVKLLSLVIANKDGGIEIRTQPSFLSKTHILASVHGVFNAVAIKGDHLGESLFYGRGAGQGPTASSVVSDLVEATRGSETNMGFLPYKETGNLVDIDDTATSYYVRFSVTDRPGVIADIASVLAKHEIGISGTHSPVDADNPDAEFVEMVFLLHTCPFGRLKLALAEVENLDCLTNRPVVFRIEAL
ncbi:MAG TPA: homoserine dehydrogenase [Verrucomicrobiales bacterium]|nr:homoserine dehydrogenase [Akkermansiaceae bacterium]HAE17710.1 homoserine dehydrogenase [Verrucomicrobiales bacterium]HCN80617.1 homoserine dehydrogenase [Verrucomicrobiales bacterium]